MMPEDSDAGRVIRLLWWQQWLTTADVILAESNQAVDILVYSVSTAGDVNGDGYSDVIVGAHGNDAGGNGAGRSYIYFGSASMDNTADV